MATLDLTEPECVLLCAALDAHRTALQQLTSLLHYDGAAFRLIMEASARAEELRRKLERARVRVRAAS